MAKVQNFLQNSGFAKVERNKKNKRTNSHTCEHDNNYFNCWFCCFLFVYFANKSKRVEKKEREELNKGLNYVQWKLKQQKQNKKNMDIFLIKSKGGYKHSPLFWLE